jgi:hypothetical protein
VTLIHAALLLFPVVLFPLPAAAHHSFAKDYDREKPVSLTGVIKKVDWSNPHVWLRLEAKDEAGKKAVWDLELSSAYSLTRTGWKRVRFQPGQTISVEAYRARDGSNKANVRTIATGNGRKEFVGSPNDGGPQEPK